MQFDVFNGDADGICSLVQLRLARPGASELITGVKRDIGLLRRAQAEAGDSVCVLDISLAKNRQALLDLLDKRVKVFYADHHQAGDISQHPLLESVIDTRAEVCTALLVDRYLNYRYSAWAAVAAFGDNLPAAAGNVVRRLGLSDSQGRQLRDLGICINYNAYGETVADLHIAPDQLFTRLSVYNSPFDYLADCGDEFQRLQDGYAGDMAQAWQTPVDSQSACSALFILPDQPWSRRVNGVWGNALALRYPDRAHAVLVPGSQGGYRVSVRAPVNNPSGADEFCSAFPGGGGRKAAAGINHLPLDGLDRFREKFIAYFS